MIRSKLFPLWVMANVFFFSLLTQASGMEWLVPDDEGCGTIQACIEHASDGDVITVGPGTYVENVDFLGKAVVLQSREGYETTILDGNQADAVVKFVSGEGEGSVLKGFTVTNAGRLGGLTGESFYGIFCEGSSPVLRDNRVTNIVYHDGGASEFLYLYAIWAENGSPRIEGNRIEENYVFAVLAGYGLGIVIKQPDGSVPVVVTGNEIQSNGSRCEHYYGVCAGSGFVFQGANIVFENNRVIYNGGSGGGHGVYCEAETILMQNNIVAYSGGESPTSYGVYLVGDDILFKHNDVYGCLGIGVFMDVSGSADILNNIVAHNDYNWMSAGGLCVQGNGLITTDYNNVWENTDDYCGGSPGPHDISADPLFADPGDLDFHLQKGSRCINRGIDAGVTGDFEGDERPLGFGFDIGADEKQPEPWSAAPEAQASASGSPSSLLTKALNPLSVVLIPAMMVLLLRIVQRKKHP